MACSHFTLSLTQRRPLMPAPSTCRRLVLNSGQQTSGFLHLNGQFLAVRLAPGACGGEVILKFRLIQGGERRMQVFRPGQRVSRSGIYRIYHASHRLMHEATLRANDIFPCCRQCGARVTFELLRPMKDALALPFRTGDILKEWGEFAKAHKKSG